MPGPEPQGASSRSPGRHLPTVPKCSYEATLFQRPGDMAAWNSTAPGRGDR